MDFSDSNVRELVAKALGAQLRQERERREWSRAQFVTHLPSGVGERTLLAYEHGLRKLTVLRLLELCYFLETEPTEFLGLALQRAMILLDNVVLQIDLRALLDDRRPKFRSMNQWARNKLNSNSDGVVNWPPSQSENWRTSSAALTMNSRSI